MIQSDKGIDWVDRHWDFLFITNISPSLLCNPSFQRGPLEGASCLYSLCSRLGIIFLKKRWNSIIKNLSSQSLRNYLFKGLFAPVIGEGKDKGASPIYYLCKSTNGRSIISTWWDDIKEHLSSQGLFAQLTGEGAEQGASPFYSLCTSEEGRAIIFSRWDDIKEHLSSKGLFAQLTGGGILQGTSPIFWL